MRSEHAFLAALLTTAALALAPKNAQAFCRTTTVVPPADFVPGTAGEGCFEQGLPLFHRSQCVPYHLARWSSEALQPISDGALSDAVARAFAAWTATNATCSPGITGIELAPVIDPTIVEYKTGERGNNVFGVVQGPWPHAGGSDTISLATLTFDATTGEIFDADLEIRREGWFGEGPDRYDLQAILTHEVGHILGLAHSNHADGVMYATYTPGSTSQRTLSADDARGICAIYPDRQTRLTHPEKGNPAGVVASTPCDLAPATGSSGGCGDPAITHGCGVASTAPSRDGMWLAGLGILGALTWRARRRLRRA